MRVQLLIFWSVLFGALQAQCPPQTYCTFTEGAVGLEELKVARLKVKKQENARVVHFFVMYKTGIILKELAIPGDRLNEEALQAIRTDYAQIKNMWIERIGVEDTISHQKFVSENHCLKIQLRK